MSPADPVTVPDSPAQPSSGPEPFRIFSAPALFLLSFAVICVAAALAVGWYGMKLADQERAAAASGEASQEAATAPTSEARLRARLAELERELAAARSGAPLAGGAQAPTYGYDPVAASALAARVQRLEEAQTRATRAAAAAVAAAALADAAQDSRPFVGELASLERAMPGDRVIEALRPLAETGAPTRAALAAEFPEVASRAALAARAPGEDASFLARAGHALSSLVTLRRVDDLSGGSPDAVLARAERRVLDGDLAGAVEQLRALPASTQAATAAWRERARRRLEIERAVGALRGSALRDLAAANAAAAPVGAPVAQTGVVQ